MTSPSLNIDYTHNGQNYTVTLYARSEGYFQAAAQQEGIRGQTGEALVAALIDFSKGGVFRVDRYKEGQRNDGPGGEPAFELIDSSGERTARLRFANGIANDGAGGAPAVWEKKDGHVAYEHRRNGQLHDAANGEPALRKYSVDGQHIHERRYQDGKLNDGPAGEPALRVTRAQTGATILIGHYADDVQTDGKTGEAAFIRYSADGRHLQEVHYMKDGRMQDSATGAAAFTRYDAAGRPLEIRHMQDGRLQDTAEAPAFRRLRADGVSPVLVERYQDGVLTDGAKGEPARERYSRTTGDLLSVARFAAGQRNDGPNGEPALTGYKRGVLVRREHYTQGALNDSVNGDHAVQKFFLDEDGTVAELTERARYKNGLLNDAPDGSPAVEKFNSRGEVNITLRYRDGLPCNGPDGAPSVLHYLDGAVTLGSRALADGTLQPLTPREIRALNGEESAPRKHRPRLPRFGR